MPFCPNLSNPEVKKEFDNLIKEHGENKAYYLWDRYKGKVPANVADAKSDVDKWFTDRFGENTVFIKNSLKNIYGDSVFGYVAAGAAYLDSSAPLSTKYHEGFHLLFRTALTDQQRQELYKDAIKQFGEPSIEAIDELATLYPNASLEDIQDIALEEMMAEEFRDYAMSQEMPKGLTAKIKKFFKDLLAYIKALAGKPLTMNIAFRVLESNKIPNSFVRNAESFSDSRVYMIKEFAQNREVHKELLAVGAKHVIDIYDETIKNATITNKERYLRSVKIVQDLLGDPLIKQNSPIQSMYLKLSLSYSNGKELSDGDFFEYKRLYDNNLAQDTEETRQALDEFTEAKDIDSFPPVMNADNQLISSKFDMADTSDAEMDRVEELSRNFRRVYNYWYDQELPSGRIQKGFRTELLNSLQNYGVSVREEQDFERTYTKSRLQESHVEKLSGQQRVLLSRIPIQNTSRTFTGLQTYIPATEVYKAVLEAAADKENFVEMLNSLEARAKVTPHLSLVYDFVNNLSAQEQAMFFDAFNLSANEFATIELIPSEDGGRVVKVFSPNVGGVLKQYEILWKRRSTAGGGILQKRVNTKGDVVGFTPNPSRIEEVRDLMAKVGIDKNGTTSITSFSPAQQADFARLLMASGFEIAESEQEAIDRVQKVYAGEAGENVPSINYIIQNTQFGQVLKQFTRESTGPVLIGKNPFEDESSTMKVLINAFVAPFEVSKALSFVNLANKSIYPINLKSRINDEKIRVKNGKLRQTLEGTLQHDAAGKKSLLLKLLSHERVINGERRNPFIEDHHFVDNDGMKIPEEIFELEDLGNNEVYAIKLSQWINKKDYGIIILDTQGDRKRMTGGMFPKLKKDNDYGIDLSTPEKVKELFKDELLLDLNRMVVAYNQIKEAQKSKDFSKLIPGYHYRETGGKKVFSAGGWVKFNTLNTSLQFVNNTFKVDDNIPLSTLVSDVSKAEKGISKKLDGVLNSFAEKAYANLELYKQEILDDFGGTTGFDGFVKDNLDTSKAINSLELLEEFVLYDTIGRMMYRQMFRDGVNFTKDGFDYVKRSQLISTPGYKGVLKGDLSADPDYGLPRTYNATTIKDIIVSLDDSQLEEFKKKIMEVTDGKGNLMYSEEAADRIVNTYKGMESTDGQSFITVEHWYNLMQWRGKTTEEVDAAYKTYKETGVWPSSVRFTAMKPSYDGRNIRDGLAVNYSDKTSYVVLTREVAKGMPALLNLIDRMEVKGQYEGSGLEKIDVVQVESAQKLALVPSIEVDLTGQQDLSIMSVAAMDSQYLRFPEDTPMKKDKEEVLLGRQQKVNMLTNLSNDQTFYYNPGLENETAVDGLTMKRIFHKAIKTKLEQNLEAIYRDIGYDLVLQAAELGNAEIVEARINDMIPKIRETLIDMSDKDFNQAMEDALSINPATGKPTLPLGYASIQGKFDQVLFSIFKNKAYKQKVKGLQMVQFADFGPKRIDETLDDSLKFLNIDGDRVAHAEVDLRADFLRHAGVSQKIIDEAIRTGDTSNINEEIKRVIAYRIPQQGKSSSIILKIRNILPESHDGVARVPSGITNMMGSDFDIDKMFFLFPEIATAEYEDGDSVSYKVQVPYDLLKADPNNVASLDEPVLNNILFDTFEAILSSTAHVHEVFTPIDGTDLKVARDNSIFATKNLDIFSPQASVKSFLDNMLSHKLRGAYANAVLGRNVVMGALNDPKSLFHTAFDLDDVMVFTDTDSNGEKITVESPTLQTTSLFPDVLGAYRPTDYFMSLHLGAAVDSVKDPLQEAINDNGNTAKYFVYGYSKGLSPRQMVALTNHPVFRAVTNGELSIDSLGMELLEEANMMLQNPQDFPGINIRLMSDAEFASKASREIDFDLLRSEHGTPVDELDYERMVAMYYLLRYMNTVSSDLANLYRLATPFTIDDSGTTAQNLASYDEAMYAMDKESSGGVYGNKEIITPILRGNAYESARAYHEAIAKNLDVATKAGFIANQKALSTFRQTLAGLSNGDSLNVDLQELVLRTTRLFLATRPGSALYDKGYTDEVLVKNLLLRKKDNIHDEYDTVRAILARKGISNAFVESLKKEEKNLTSKKILYYMEFNNTIRRDNSDESAIMAGWEAMYFNTADVFTEAEGAIMKRFAEHMITNTIFTTGMNPGPKSVAALIPPLMLEDIGVAEDYYQGTRDLDNYPTYLVNGMLGPLIETYGHERYKGKSLARSVSAKQVGIKSKFFPTEHVKELAEKDIKYFGRYILVRKGNNTKLYTVERGDVGPNSRKGLRTRMIKLVAANRLGVPGAFYEMNVRSADGTLKTNSLLSNETSVKLDNQIISHAQEKYDEYKKIEAENEGFDESDFSAADFNVGTGNSVFGEPASSTPETGPTETAEKGGSPDVSSSIAEVSVVDRYSVQSVQNDPNRIYVFGDNLNATGKGGQAVIRDLENAFGIVTKAKPSTGKDAYFYDTKLEANKAAIDNDILAIKQDGRPVVFPKDGLGTGLAKLEEKAPKTFAYLNQRLLEEFRFDNLTGQVIFKSEFDVNDDPNAPTSDSIFSKTIDLLGMQRDMPKTLTEKINRLSKAFTAAGVDVSIVLDTLPPGVKGMVDNGIVILDPNQVTEDTAYHELGHILVDMLPQDEVDAYIREAINANPELAEMVTANYPELSGRELGKEILVTAIGIEGAKIERKNPTRLQRLINRILRAIGKLFGIKPNAAAVLAERMFAGDIRMYSLDGKYDAMKKLSKEMQQEADTVFQDAYEHLERRLRDLRFKQETEGTEYEKARIIEIQNTLKRMNENKENLDAFLEFSMHVGDQVRIVERALEDIETARNKPIDKEEALYLLRKADHVREQLETLYNTNRSNSVTDQITGALTGSLNKFDPNDEGSARQILVHLQENLLKMRDFERRYLDNVIPLVADVYNEYESSELDARIQNTVDAIIRNRDTTINPGEENTPKIKELLSRKGKMEAEGQLAEWEDMMIDAKVEALKNKKSGRENIINELKSAYRDKSLFSLYLDPIVYSNQTNLQLFAITLKDGDRKANQKSLADIRKSEQVYNDLKAYKGTDFNKETFFDEFLEVREVYKDGKPVKVLSLVQPFTVDYSTKKTQMYKDLIKKYNRPVNGTPEEFEAWVKSPDAKAYKKEKAQWFKANSVQVPDAATKYAALKENYADKNSLLAQMIADANFAAAAVLEAEVKELRIKLGAMYDENTNTYMGDLAMPNSTYANPKYQEIMAVPQLANFHNFVLNQYKEYQKIYGASNPQQMHAWDDFSYIAPTVRRSDLEAVQRTTLKGAYGEFIDNLKRSDTDQEMYGAAFDQDDNPVKYLPRYFTNIVDEKYVTKDILSSILTFGHKAYQYEEKAKLTGLVNAMLNVYERREVIRVDDSGRSLLSREASRVKEAFAEKYLGDIVARKSGDKSNTYNHLSQFIDVAFYGILKRPLDSKIFGMDPNKVAVTLNSLAAMGSLSFNTLQIGNQFILDNITQRQEAMAGEYFNNKDLRWARLTYASVGGGVRDLGAFAAKTKLGKAAMHFDALVDINDNLGNKLTSNKVLKAMSQGTLFALQGSIEFQTATTRMLAAMKATEGKFKDSAGNVIMNESGKEANLWDLMIETEKGVELDPRVDLKQSEYNEAKFIAKLHGLSKRTNQIKGNADAPTIARGPLGTLLMLFKNYFIPGFRKRFGHGNAYHVDHELDGVTRGYYYSYLSFLKLLRTGMKNGTKFGEIYAGMSDVDKANIRRFHTEAAIILSSMAIYQFLAAILEDDDDDENYMVAYLAYQARRLQTEMLAYAPGVGFGETIRLFKSPIATANRAAKTWDFITHITNTEIPYTVVNTLGTPSEQLTKDAIYQRDSYWG